MNTLYVFKYIHIVYYYIIIYASIKLLIFYYNSLCIWYLNNNNILLYLRVHSFLWNTMHYNILVLLCILLKSRKLVIEYFTKLFLGKFILYRYRLVKCESPLSCFEWTNLVRNSTIISRNNWYFIFFFFMYE